jgi:hypothetical protein
MKNIFFSVPKENTPARPIEASFDQILLGKYSLFEHKPNKKFNFKWELPTPNIYKTYILFPTTFSNN